EVVRLGDETGRVVLVVGRRGTEPHAADEQHRGDQRARDPSHAPAPSRRSLTAKRLPAPGVESASTVPPCACTMLFTMARPSPDPPRAPSTCQYRSKTCGSASGAMPTPVSVTTISTSSSRGTVPTRTVPPGGVNLIALDTRLTNTWRR